MFSVVLNRLERIEDGGRGDSQSRPSVVRLHPLQFSCDFIVFNPKSLTKALFCTERKEEWAEGHQKPEEVQDTPGGIAQKNVSVWSEISNPRGYGNWAFKIGKETKFFAGKYSDAKKKAVKEAASKGINSITTLS